MNNKPERYIIVDGLSASGEEIIYVSNLVKAMNAEVRFVFTVIDSCFGAKDRARNESPFVHPVELVFIAEYDDRNVSISKSSNYILLRGTYVSISNF